MKHITIDASENISPAFNNDAEDTMTIEDAKQAVFDTRARQREERYIAGYPHNTVIEFYRAEGVPQDYLKLSTGM